MNTITETHDVLEFIKKRELFITTQGIEKYLELPPTTLFKFLNGSRNFPKKHIPKLENFCEEFFGYVKEKTKDKE